MKEARALGLEVIDRCNLTVLLEPGQEDLVDFLAENQVKSIPQECTIYSVDQTRVCHILPILIMVSKIILITAQKRLGVLLFSYTLAAI